MYCPLVGKNKMRVKMFNYVKLFFLAMAVVIILLVIGFYSWVTGEEFIMEDDEDYYGY